jgi:hypothetical protein
MRPLEGRSSDPCQGVATKPRIVNFAVPASLPAAFGPLQLLQSTENQLAVSCESEYRRLFGLTGWRCRFCASCWAVSVFTAEIRGVLVLRAVVTSGGMGEAASGNSFRSEKCFQTPALPIDSPSPLDSGDCACDLHEDPTGTDYAPRVGSC